MKLLNSGSGLVVTIPKSMAEGLDWKAGDRVTWKIAGKNRLELVKD